MAFHVPGKVIVLVDMDCFYVQVEQRRNPELKGKPCAVVQYRQKNGGGIIAVGYEARKYGVTRVPQLRGDEARIKCPDIQLVAVPERRGKADLTHYREASAEVIQVLSQFSESIERASIDEAFLDITKHVHDRINDMEFRKVIPSMLPSTHVAGKKATTSKDDEVTHSFNSEELKESLREGSLSAWLEEEGNGKELSLTVGALITTEMRNAILQETGFTCSAGIASNKMLAKLAAGMNKPNQQTILPMTSVPAVFNNTAIKKVRHLGGKLGEEVQKKFGIDKIGQLTCVERKKLETCFGEKTGLWLYNLCRGISDEPIRVKTIPLSVGCGKNFYGREKLTTIEQVLYWLKQLAEEIVERLALDQRTNNRTASQLTVHFQPEESETSLSRSCPLNSLDAAIIVKNAWSAMNKGRVAPPSMSTTTLETSTKLLAWSSGILNLSLVASKFRNHSTSTAVNTISSYFTKQESQLPSSNVDAEVSKTKDPDQSGNAAHIQVEKHPSSANHDTAITKDISSYFPRTNKPMLVVPRTDQASSNSDSCTDSLSASPSQSLVSSRSDKSTISSYFNKPPALECSLLDTPVSDGQSKPDESKTNNYCAIIGEQSTVRPVHTSPSILDYFADKGTAITVSVAGPVTKKRRLSFDESCVPFEEENSVLFQTCSECSENIPVWEIQEHKDFHFALQLHNNEKQPMSDNHCKKPTSNHSKNSILNYFKNS